MSRLNGELHPTTEEPPVRRTSAACAYFLARGRHVECLNCFPVYRRTDAIHVSPICREATCQVSLDGREGVIVAPRTLSGTDVDAIYIFMRAEFPLGIVFARHNNQRRVDSNEDV